MSDSITIVDKPNFSERFNLQDAEIVFQSSDGIRFRIHRLNLSLCSEGFSPPDHSTFDDVVILTESSSTLDLLFRFIYPEPQPDVEKLEFDDLALLAEASEKYQVYSAINTCTINLIKRLPEHAADIMIHALKHGKRPLLNRAAPLLLDNPVNDMLMLFPDHHVRAWVKYHAQWSDVSKNLIDEDCMKLEDNSACQSCYRKSYHRVIEAMNKLSNKMDTLHDFDSLFPKCESCIEPPLFDQWKKKLKERIEGLPSAADIFWPKDLAIYKERSMDTEIPVFDEKSGTLSFGNDADISFISSDDVSFNLHQNNIQLLTKNIIHSDYDALTGPIPLPEDSSTLKVLFKFIYLGPHPDLEACDFPTLEVISAGADKYEIYPAIAITGMRLRDALPHNLRIHPFTVMRRAVRTRNFPLIDQAAPLLIGTLFAETAKLFAPAMVLAWLDYHERWQTIARNALKFASERPVSDIRIQVSKSTDWRNPYQEFTTLVVVGCKGCSEPSDCHTVSILGKLGTGVQSLQNLDDTYDVKGCCDTSSAHFTSWRTSVEHAIQELPTFTSLLI